MQNSPASDRGEQAVEERRAEEPAEPADGRDLQAELNALEDRYKRAVADLDNYRKRSQRDVQRQVAESREGLLREWLETVDSVERALLMAEADSPLAVGLQAVLVQMEVLLERQGLRRIGTVGEAFDPERHEAVGLHVTSEAPPNTIVEVARSGWAMDDRVLRPAQVVVARAEEREG
jgi:molecular chaperone GrpE